MGVLDELKQEAEKAQAEREKEQSAEVTQKAELERKLVTRVDDLYSYFKEFQKQLSVVDPQVTGDFNVQDLCKLTNLKQGEYKLATDDVSSVRKFTFHYTCTGSGVREIKLPSRVIAEQKKEYLWACNLKFKLKDQAGGRCSILMEAFVPVSFEFEADLEKAAVRLRVKNKPMLGVSNYSYSADQINSDFMDEVAKYILDKSNRFDELSGNTMPEDTLIRLRAQLAGKGGGKSKEKVAEKSGLKEILTKPLFGKKS